MLLPHIESDVTQKPIVILDRVDCKGDNLTSLYGTTLLGKYVIKKNYYHKIDSNHVFVAHSLKCDDE